MDPSNSLLKYAVDRIPNLQTIFAETPFPSMEWLAWQSLVPVVGAGYNTFCGIDPQIQWVRPLRYSKAAPHLGRILSVDLHGVMGRGPTLPKTLRPLAVTRDTTVYDHPLSPQR